MEQKMFDINVLSKVTKEDCFICKNKIESESIIYEDDKFIAFLDAYAPTKGYTLIAPKKHIEDITDMKEADYLEMQKLLHNISLSIKKNLNPKRVCFLSTGGIVKHFHFHIIPMYKNNSFKNFADEIIKKKSILVLSKKETQDLSNKIKENLK